MPEAERLRTYLRRVTNELQASRQRLAAIEGARTEPIAVVGMACRFPGGANDPASLWRVLSDGTDTMTPFPASRGWDMREMAIYAKALEGAFVADAYDFDASFFGISPREALAMDPQQRLLLQCAWEACEDAGIDPESLRRTKVGVFSGVMYQDYATRLREGSADLRDYLSVAGSDSVVSGRIAYAFGLEGPTLSVDTACSSSLVALHLAVQALRRDECQAALVTGSMIMSTPAAFESYGLDGALSSSGRCRAFSADADGTGWGEGVGTLYLERVSKARELGHTVLATIRGSAVNQDGASSGLTAPNGSAQRSLIVDALADAGLTAGDVDLIEAHGTGTRLGDPIEANSLHATYGRGHTIESPVWLGSIKSNIGHTQAAAGVAGVMKVILALRHERMPETLWISEPTDQVDWDGTVRLLTGPRPWPRGERVRRGCVSGFGFSGTNAHVIIEEGDGEDAGQARTADAGTGELRLPVVLSAPSAASVSRQAARLAAFLADQDVASVDVGRSMAGRHLFRHRAAIPAGSRQELVAGLGEVTAGGGIRGERVEGARLVFFFPGQGGHWPGMGQDLLALPVFAEAVADCRVAFGDELGFDLEDWFRSGRAGAAADPVDVVQPCLFTMMVGLARLWASVGVAPDAVMSASLGEPAAFYVAGALSLEAAARIVMRRSRLLASISGECRMLNVRAAAAVAADHICELGLDTSAYVVGENSPDDCTLAGQSVAIDAVQAALEAHGITVRVVRNVGVASHSPFVESIRDGLIEALADFEAGQSAVPVYSAVTGCLLDTNGLGAEHWYRNTRQPLLLRQETAAVLADGYDVIVELSPHPGAAIALDQTASAAEAEFRHVASLHRGGGVADFEACLAELAVVADVPVADLWMARGGNRTALPFYAFEPRSFYLPDPGGSANLKGSGLDSVEHPLLRTRVALATDGAVVLTGRLAAADHPWCADHAVNGRTLLPATVFLELALRAADFAGLDTVDELVLTAPLEFGPESTVDLQVVLDATDDEGGRPITLWSRTDPIAEWQQHCAGRVCAGVATRDERLDHWPPEGESLDPEAVYAGFVERGIEYGDSFRGLRALWRGDDEVWAEVRLPEGTSGRDGFLIDPVLLDMSLHGLGALFEGSDTGVPYVWSSAEMYAEGADSLRVQLRRTGASRASVTLYDPAGDIVGRVRGLTVRPLADPVARRVGSGDLLALEWVPARARVPRRRVWFADPGVPEAVAAALGGGDLDDRTGEEGSTLCYAADPGADPVELTARVMRRMQAHLDVDGGGQLVICTCGGQYAPGDQDVDVAQAAVWGFVRGAQTEHPGAFAVVDVDGHGESLLALAQLPEDLDQVVIRRGVLLEPVLARVAPELRDGLAWDRDRVVLVTGAGGIGGVLARQLVTHEGVRHLVLASRRGAQAPGAEDLAAELREAGADDVSFVACDLADPSQVRGLIARASADRPLGAVVHTAGRLLDGVLSRMDEASLQEVFAPKVAAVQLLDELTRPLDLDAFVVCSSAAGTFGAAGQANYAAANAALDAACRRRALAGAPALSLAWGPWVADGTAASTDAGRRSGLTPIDFEVGADLFERALGGPVVQLPLVLDRMSLRRFADAGSVPTLLLPFAGVRRRRAATSVEAAADELSSLSLEDRRERLCGIVRDGIVAVLGYESGAELDQHQAFRDMGLDSLTALQLRNRLTEVLGVKLPVTLVFEHSSIAALADHLAGATGAAALAAPRRSARVAMPAGPAADNPIAIVAASCRFPGGIDTPDALWRAVVAGRDLVSDIPLDRGWDIEALVDPTGERPGTIRSGTGGFLERAYDFDPVFFGISPREGSAMDPLQRLSLELTWEALERAQIDPSMLRGTRTSVFLGVMYQDYGAHFDAVPDELLPYIGNGSTASVASGRIAYTLGLEGPAVTVDTACSSSLVAVHMAAQSLRSGESSLALAGGGIVMSTPGLFVNFGNIKGISSSGRSKAFSAAADGAGLGEGVGMVLLERLDDAQRAGHPVLAILRGSAMNQDGASNGLTAPSGPAQERVIVRALDDAGVTPSDVDIVEAHGTGTSLGDPIEVRALMHTYGAGRDDDHPLWVGSVKSNIGHTQAAAGVAGLIKMIGALHHRTLPPTLHAYPLSDKIDWTEAPVVPLAEPRPWPDGRKRLAGVSAFGISGTNCHVIVGEAPPSRPHVAALRGDCGPIVVTGRTGDAASAMALAVADLLDDTDTPVADIAQAAVQGRKRFGHYVVAAGVDREALASALRTAPVATRAPTTKTAFLFTGMAAQRLGMAKDLVNEFPVFADALAEVAELIQERLGRDVREVVYGTDAELLDSTLWTQVSTFAVQIGLERLLASLGVRPDAVLGHSLGAVAAAYSAGVLDLRDAVGLVCMRGSLMDRVSGGAVVSLEVGEELVRKALTAVGGRADVAGQNTPTATVISGEESAVIGVIDFLGVRSKRLRMATASHSPLVEPILDELAEFASGLTYSEPRIPVISNLDGRPVTAFDGRHWADLVRGTVRFADGLAWLGGHGYARFLEVGPDAILTAMGRANLPEATFIPTLRRTRPDAESFAEALGALHATGTTIDWPAYFGRPLAPDAGLPTYPFQRERLWVAGSRSPGATGGTGRALLASSVPVAGSDEILAEARLSLGRQPWLADHVVDGTILVPGACWVELVAEAAAGQGLDAVSELVIEQPLALAPETTIEVQLRFGADGEDGRFVGWARSGDEPWARHVSGRAVASEDLLRVEAFDPSAGESLDISTLYDDLAAGGFAYGPTFQGLESARRAGNVLYADVVLGDPAGAEGFEVHPALLDAAAHVVMATELASAAGAQLPFCWRGVRVARRAATAATVRVTALDGSTLRVEAVDLDGEPLFAVEELLLRPKSQAAGPPLYRVGWHALPATSPRAHHAVVVPLSAGAAALGESVAEAVGGATLAQPATWSSAVRSAEDVVYFVVGDDHDQTGPAGVHAVTGAVLDAIQSVLAVPDRPTAVFVTAAAVAAVDSDAPDPAHAAVWGMVRAAQSENPRTFGLLDVDVDGSLAACPPGDWEAHDQIAFRGVFLVPELTIAAPVAARRPIEGTALIAGGGAIAAELARHLADRGAQRIVVASRSGDAARGMADLVAELGQRGVSLEPVAADLSTPDGQAPLWQHLEGVALGEVYYTAAVLADGLVHNLTREALTRVLTAKVDGAWYLLEQLRSRGGTGSVVLFSSAAGTIGAAGQANYSAANSALDALAVRSRTPELAVTSIAFGLWGETHGMATGIAGGRAKGMLGLSNAEALDLLDRAAAGPEALAVAMRFEVSGLRELANSGTLPGVLRGMAPKARPASSASSVSARPLAALRGESRRSAVLDIVRQEIAGVLGHDLATVDEGYPLVDCGFDSLMAIELRNRLAKATGLTLSPSVVFDHATPSDLAATLDGQLATARRTTARPASPGSLSLRGLYSEALGRGEFGKGTDLLELVGSMRPQFGLGDDERAVITPLSRGEGPALYCFNSCMATAGTHSYARFAAALGGRREVNVVALPGFADGERLPAVMAAAVAAQVAAVRAHAGGRPLVLLGTSAGGWFAHAAAVELERQGVGVAGSALIDCYLPTSNFLDSFGLNLVGAMTEREESFEQSDDTRLIASGWYTRLFGGFLPEPVLHPQVLLRATQPLGRDVHGDGWRSTWPLPHDAIDVEGNHFSIMEDNCESTVEVLESWIQRVC